MIVRYEPDYNIMKERNQKEHKK